MLINVEKLKQEGKSSVDYSMEIEPSQLEIEDVKILKPVKIDFTVKVLGEEILLKGKYETEAEYQCVRCLEPFKKVLKGKYETLFFTEDSDGKEEEENYYDEEMFREPLVNGKIDIAGFVRENILLEMDQYPICKEECSGVENFEEYDNKGIDPRWQQLINIIKENK